MNQFVPDWGIMGDTSRPLGEDDDLMELLWCNGHVVMQSQGGHRKPPPRPEKVAAAPPVQAEDDAGLWFPFALADSLDKDIFSDLFYEAPPPGAQADNKPGSWEADCKPSELMPPPKSTSMSMSLADNAGELSDLVQARAGKAAMEEGASSTLSAIGASFCGSNQVQVQRAASEQGGRAGTTAYGGGSGSALPSAVGSGNANGRGRGHEATVASSSGRSNYCFGGATTTTTTTTTTTGTEPTSTSNRSSKRKRGLLDTDDSTESPSEDAESESAALERKPPQKLATVRRSRAAEVHNLSERRRRDRINEKMRALQELIPHCNKTDKASMLDEAIEYLKSLQMQVQMMWMGSGMAAPPVMFPGMHQYLPQMGVGARMPFMPPQRVAQQGHGRMPEHYAHFLGAVNHLQPPLPAHHHQVPTAKKIISETPAVSVSLFSFGRDVCPWFVWLAALRAGAGLLPARGEGRRAERQRWRHACRRRLRAGKRDASQQKMRVMTKNVKEKIYMYGCSDPERSTAVLPPSRRNMHMAIKKSSRVEQRKRWWKSSGRHLSSFLPLVGAAP